MPLGENRTIYKTNDSMGISGFLLGVGAVVLFNMWIFGIISVPFLNR